MLKHCVILPHVVGFSLRVSFRDRGKKEKNLIQLIKLSTLLHYWMPQVFLQTQRMLRFEVVWSFVHLVLCRRNGFTTAKINYQISNCHHSTHFRFVFAAGERRLFPARGRRLDQRDHPGSLLARRVRRRQFRHIVLDVQAGISAVCLYY